MTDTIKISDFQNQEDRTLLVGCDIDDSYWLHVYLLDSEFHIITYLRSEDGEESIVSEFVADGEESGTAVDGIDPENFVTWNNFAETVDPELKDLLEDRGVKFSLDHDADFTFEADEDGFLGPIMSDLD